MGTDTISHLELGCHTADKAKQGRAKTRGGGGGCFGLDNKTKVRSATSQEEHGKG